MKDDSSVTRSIIDELHFSDIQGDQMEGESGVARTIIDELDSWNIQRDQMEGESGVSRSIIDEIYSSDIQGDQMEVVLPSGSLTQFILRRSKEIKWNVKVV